MQEYTNPQQWHYVPTKMNPADLVSRGVLGSELPQCSLWWNGPDFLKGDEDGWPTLDKTKMVSEKLEAVETTLQAFTEERCLTKKVDYFQPKTLSSCKRLVRVRAWIRTFCENFRAVSKEMSGSLTQEEIERAELEIIMNDQKEQFEKEYQALSQGLNVSPKSSIIRMNPVLDQDGVLRSESRLVNAETNFVA